MKPLFYIALILCVSLFVLYPTFNLALLGDDWLAFHRYSQHLGPKSSGEFNHLTYFLTPYGAQDIMMGILQRIYNYDSTKYYLTSYFLRIIAAFSLYPLVTLLTNNRYSAIFAVLFFSITVVGFDTTNWSSNMTTYITIAAFNLFLFIFIKIRSEGNFLKLLFADLIYYIAYITTPIRMHGSLIFIFLLELFWVLQKRNLQTVKRASLRFLSILGVFLIIRFTGSSLGPPNEPIERLLLGIKTSSELLSQGRIDFLLYPIMMFGSMIIPDFMLPQEARNVILSLIGGCILATLIFLIFKLFKKYNISTALYLSLSWSILSFFFAWWWVPTTIFPTTYRYLVVSVVGVSILFATIIALGKNKAQQRLLFTLLSFILILHIVSTRTYTNYLINSHSQNISNKIWSSIPRVPDIGRSKEATIFYFEGEPGTETIIHDVITFGFPPHMARLYHLREEDGNFPIGTSEWQEVITAILNGEVQTMYGPTVPTNLERVYAFYLAGKNNLIDITDKAREKLKQIKSQSNQ